MFVFHFVRTAKGVIFAPFLRYDVVAILCNCLIIIGIVANFVAVNTINENHILNFKD